MIRITIFICIFTLNVTPIEWEDFFQNPLFEKKEYPASVYESDEAQKQFKPLTESPESLDIRASLTHETNMEESLIQKFLTEEEIDGSTDELKNFSYSITSDSQIKNASYVNPGFKTIFSYQAIKNMLLGYLPMILAMTLRNPLDIKYDYGNISLSKIQVAINSLDLNNLSIGIDIEENKLVIIFPRTELTVYITTLLCLGANVEGMVTSNVVLDSLQIGLQFYKEQAKNFFKPRVLLTLDNIDIHEAVTDIKAAFDNLPEFMVSPILSIFEDVIKNSLNTYIQDTFGNKGSAILNYMIDKKYPGAYNVFKNHLRMSMLMTREPLVTKKGLILSITGDLFNSNIVDEGSFVPSSNNNPIMEPEVTEEYNTQILLSLEFVQNTILGFFTHHLGEINNMLTAYKFYKIVLLKENITIEDYGINLKKMVVHFYLNRPEIDQYGNIPDSENIKEITGSIKIDYIDLNLGKLRINLSNLKLIDWDDKTFWNLMQMPLNFLSHMLVCIFSNGEYDIFKPDFESGFSMSAIEPVYKKDYLVLQANLEYAEPQKLYYFLI